jgi:hypothetical protein
MKRIDWEALGKSDQVERRELSDGDRWLHALSVRTTQTDAEIDSSTPDTDDEEADK